jgi:hypothetical protein
MYRKFRSPNAGQTSLALQHSTSPRSGYKPALGHNRDGYPMGGIPIRTGFKRGGSAQQKLIKGKQERAAKEKDRHQRALEWRKKNAGDQFKEILKDPTKLRHKFKKGGWIQDVNKSIKKRGTKGKCTPITKKGCTGRAKALAMTFKKMGRARKGK